MAEGLELDDLSGSFQPELFYDSMKSLLLKHDTSVTKPEFKMEN